MSEKPMPKRCQAPACKVKLGITSFACRCSLYYCPTHRLPESHECKHDFQKEHRELLLKTMSSPIIAPKIEAL